MKNKTYLDMSYTIWYPDGIDMEKADDIMDRFLDIIEETENAQAAGGYRLKDEDDYE